MGTEVYLSLVDLDFRPSLPAVETLTVHATCTNRDLPGKLPFGGEQGAISSWKARPPLADSLPDKADRDHPARRCGEGPSGA